MIIDILLLFYVFFYKLHSLLMKRRIYWLNPLGRGKMQSKKWCPGNDTKLHLMEMVENISIVISLMGTQRITTTSGQKT